MARFAVYTQHAHILSCYIGLITLGLLAADLLEHLRMAVEKSSRMAESPQQLGNQPTAVGAAGAFPAIAEAAGPPRWPQLKPVLAALVRSGDHEVIHSLAEGLPRLARVLGPERAATEWLPALQVCCCLNASVINSTAACQIGICAGVIFENTSILTEELLSIG